MRFKRHQPNAAPRCYLRLRSADTAAKSQQIIYKTVVRQQKNHFKMKINSIKILSLLFFLVLPFQEVMSQEGSELGDEIVFDRAEKKKKLNQQRELFVQKYIDSLNGLKVTQDCELPDFFTNSDFDQQYGSQFMHGMHGRISLRKFIIDELTNYNLMWCVVKSKDKRIHKKYKGKSKRFYLYKGKIPFEQYSTFELVDMRLDELENENHAGIEQN